MLLHIVESNDLCTIWNVSIPNYLQTVSFASVKIALWCWIKHCMASIAPKSTGNSSSKGIEEDLSVFSPSSVCGKKKIKIVAHSTNKYLHLKIEI